MREIEYVKFDDVDPNQFIDVLNEESIRGHLISHKLFDSDSVQAWVAGKTSSGEETGCRIRAVFVDDTLVGWCGIQKDSSNYEIAIVISQSAWGIGTHLFRDLMAWAKELGHSQVVIHLLESRPVYKALEKRALKTTVTEMLGRKFRTYFFTV